MVQKWLLGFCVTRSQCGKLVKLKEKEKIFFMGVSQKIKTLKNLSEFRQKNTLKTLKK